MSSGELYVKQSYSFVNGAYSILMNVGKSKYYWYYTTSNYGTANTSSSIRSYVTRPSYTYCDFRVTSATCYSPTYSLSSTRWNSTLPKLNIAMVQIYGGCSGDNYNWRSPLYSFTGTVFLNGVLYDKYIGGDNSCS